MCIKCNGTIQRLKYNSFEYELTNSIAFIYILLFRNVDLNQINDFKNCSNIPSRRNNACNRIDNVKKLELLVVPVSSNGDFINF